ncbi:hypothetical protein AB0L05_34045 [Nonomuraea pusilla]|uniref:hypothetical protein n=1 Tax=Nonomuraea pusilla TaxID=46177 RepID=UPI00331D4AE4
MGGDMAGAGWPTGAGWTWGALALLLWQALVGVAIWLVLRAASRRSRDPSRRR